MEGIYTQYPTGFSCDVCDGIAVVEVDDGDHYLCAAHAIEAVMEINLTGDEPIVTIADEPAPASNDTMIGAPSTALDVVVTDTDVRELLTDVVSGLRAIRRRLETTPASQTARTAHPPYPVHTGPGVAPHHVRLEPFRSERSKR